MPRSEHAGAGSTPVARYLRGIDSWDTSPEKVQDAFRVAMQGRSFAREQCIDAWHWFDAGYLTAAAAGKAVFR